MDSDTAVAALQELVDDYRARCLWFLREDYYPGTAAERERAPSLIAEHGDLDAFRRRAAEIRALGSTAIQRDVCRLLAAARVSRRSGARASRLRGKRSSRAVRRA